MKNGEDISWKDAWDFDRAIELLAGISDKYGRAGDYSTMGHIDNIIAWMTDAQEAILEAQHAITDLADARRALYKVPR